MSELTEVLLARIAEDEAVAQNFIAEGPWQEWAAEDFKGPHRDDEYAGLNIGAGRVVRECQAKRRIVWRFQNGASDSRQWNKDALALLGTSLRDLASVYADHPDYREEWKP